MKEMRNKMMIWVLGALVLCLTPAVAQSQQQHEWQSTSVMVSSGSNYAPQVTAVGSTSAASEATTTESYSPAKAPNGPRFFPKPGETGQSEEYPIGDAVLPMALMAMAFAGVIAWRRRRSHA